MSGIEQLKRRVDSLAPAPAPGRLSAWERMNYEEKRADCRKWIKVWTDAHPEDLLTEEETKAMITRLIRQVDDKRTGSGPTSEDLACMPDAEIERRAREIMDGSRHPKADGAR